MSDIEVKIKELINRVSNKPAIELTEADVLLLAEHHKLATGKNLKRCRWCIIEYLMKLINDSNNYSTR
jgi:hypothetical protein